MKNQPDGLNGTTLIENLLMPGQSLVFVDDSGTQGKQVPNLAADFECLCGVAMTSDDYANARNKSQRLLKNIVPSQLEEIHSTDLVNPAKDHPWRSVPLTIRADVLRVLFSCVGEFSHIIYHGFYSGEQLRSTPELAGNQKLLRRGPKGAVETVFRNCLVPHLLDSGRNSVIVWDSTKPAVESMKIETLRRPKSNTTCEIMHADSRFVFGLQLADLIAYSFNRRYRIKHRAEQGTGNAMDETILDGLLALKNHFVDVLSLRDLCPS